MTCYSKGRFEATRAHAWKPMHGLVFFNPPRQVGSPPHAARGRPRQGSTAAADPLKTRLLYELLSQAKQRGNE